MNCAVTREDIRERARLSQRRKKVNHGKECVINWKRDVGTR